MVLVIDRTSIDEAGEDDGRALGVTEARAVGGVWRDADTVAPVGKRAICPHPTTTALATKQSKARFIRDSVAATVPGSNCYGSITGWPVYEVSKGIRVSDPETGQWCPARDSNPRPSA